MKQSKRLLIAILAVSALAGGGAAYADRGAGGQPGGCGPHMSGRSAAEFADSRLQKLHADLKLAPEQEAAWKSWSDPLRKQAAGMADHRAEREAMAKLPAPERMEKALERMKTHQQQMEANLASLRSFYTTLTPEQRQTFDRFRPFGEHRGEHRGGYPGGARQGRG